MADSQTELTAADLAEAQRRLPGASPEDQMAFARRQLRARQRVARLREFYGTNPCRLARLHLLTASSVAVARFCGYSESFHALGEAIMPVDEQGQPKSRLWRDYQQACADRRPWTHRDELWLSAHAADWQAVQLARLDAAFFAEAAEHANDLQWRNLVRHADLTFGTRVFEQLSRRGELPQETVISLSLGLSLRRAPRQGWPLLTRYVSESLRSILWSAREDRPGVASYRQTGWTVLRSLFTSGSAWNVYRRGLRIKNRGVRAPEVEWPVLETLLGDDAEQVHPLIVQFYRNPGRFAATATLDIRTLPLMMYSRLAALLLGQGLYEGGPATIPARLHVFRREDGSMHFVRELDCGDVMRVFDSDFVLRKQGGSELLVEVFGDLGVEVILEAQLRPDRGVAVVGRDIYWRGLRLPRTALRIEFASRVCTDDNGSPFIEITGRLEMAPRTAVGRFVMHTLLRRSKDLGSIQYLVRPLPKMEPRTQQVVVVPYDPTWPQQYEKAAEELAPVLGANLVAFHHIGSTAIPGIHAKPIIDLMPVVRDLAAVDEYAGAIQQLGYEALGELGITGRRYFRRFCATGERTHHVHVFQEGSPHVKRHLAFRDYLRAHPQVAEQYSELKQRLATEHPENWDAYCDGKDVLVQKLEARALEWCAALNRLACDDSSH